MYVGSRDRGNRLSSVSNVSHPLGLVFLYDLKQLHVLLHFSQVTTVVHSDISIMKSFAAVAALVAAVPAILAQTDPVTIDTLYVNH